MLLTSEFNSMYEKLEKDCKQSTAIEEEYFFKTKYFRVPLESDLIGFLSSKVSSVNEKLHMPHKNPFVPKALTVHIQQRDLKTAESRLKAMKRLGMEKLEIAENHLLKKSPNIFSTPEKLQNDVWEACGISQMSNFSAKDKCKLFYLASNGTQSFWTNP